MDPEQNAPLGALHKTIIAYSNLVKGSNSSGNESILTKLIGYKSMVLIIHRKNASNLTNR